MPFRNSFRKSRVTLIVSEEIRKISVAIFSKATEKIILFKS